MSDVDASTEMKWAELSNSAAEPNAFLDPRFILSAERHLPETATVLLAFTEMDGRFLAAHAFSVLDIDVAFGRKFAAVATSGPLIDQVVAVRRPLLSAANPIGAATALLSGLRQRNLPGFFEISLGPQDGVVADAMREAARALRMPRHIRETTGGTWASREWTATTLSSASTWDGSVAALPRYLPHVGAATAKKHRQRVRALERELGSPLRVLERGDDTDAVAQFAQLQAAGWKGDPARGGAAFRVRGQECWLHDLASAFRADGDLSIVDVRAGETTVYMAISIRSGTGMFALQDAYDERFAALRPGTVGRLATMSHVLRLPGVESFDPSMGRAPVETMRLYPVSRPHETYILATRGVFRRTGLRAFSLLRRRGSTHEAAPVAGPAPAAGGIHGDGST